MIQFFWCPQTRASRVFWMLEELGQPYQRVTVDIRGSEGRDNPDFQAASPMGKVPAIADGAVKMADSAAICLYLADRYPEAGLAPPINHPDRGTYLYWMIYTPGVIEPSMSERFNQVEPNRMRSGWGDFDLMVETLSGQVAHRPWLLGDAFSAADVMVGSSVCFLRQFNMLPDDSSLHDYADRCQARPGFQTAEAADA